MRDAPKNPLRYREAVVRRSFPDSRAMICAGIEEWAKDSGWVMVREAESGMVYSGDATGFLGFASGVFRTYQVSVSLYDHEGGVDAKFAVGVSGQFPGVEADLERAGETFADGVSSYVGQLLGTGVEEGGSSQLTRRSRRGSITRFLKLSEGTLVIALVPAAALAYLISRSGIAAVFAWLWVGALLLSATFIRYRVYGMHMWILALAAGGVMCGTIVGTLALTLS